MSNQFYGYGSAYGGAASSLLSGSAGDEASALYSSYELDRIAARYADPFRYDAATVGLGLHSAAAAAGPGVDMQIGTRRSVEALYHQSLMGSHSTVGQSEALYSTNLMVKRPRLESSLPIYPQRPGEKDCAYYMMTRTCKFGDACKFDHPIWVPEGGIPDWKEVPLAASEESLPERPGEPDCPYFLKTSKCKFGSRCKFNHPKDKVNTSAGGTGGEGTEITDNSVLPERPSEPLCSFYAKTGKCKFGANCKFHHPKDIQIPSSGKETNNTAKTEAAGDSGAADGMSTPTKSFGQFTPALLHNSKGLPIRTGETDCPFYMKTGSCKYGATCRYNHPDRNAINPPLAAPAGQTILPPAATSVPIGVLNPAVTFLHNIDLQSAHAPIGVAPASYPQRPGEMACDYYMKTGQCKFAERCRFHHPIDRSTTGFDAKSPVQQNVRLTLAGLPRREGAEVCAFYMKTGTCKFGVTCKFDHPPPGEAVAKATLQGAGSAAAAAATEGGEK